MLLTLLHFCVFTFSIWRFSIQYLANVINIVRVMFQDVNFYFYFHQNNSVPWV
jgi:hypothetical protein